MPDSQPPTNELGVESRLQESEARYRAVIENASDMIQSCRPDGTFEFVNRTWLEKMGYTEDELDSLVIWDVLHPDSIEHCQALFMRAVQGETIEHVQATFQTKDGQPLPVEGNATSRFAGGKVIATHSFFRDISERLRAQELEERNAQLEREQMARYLEKMAALGKLAAGLAHELNNPAAAAQRAGEQLATSAQRRDRALTALHELGLSSAQWERIDTFVNTATATAPAPGSLRTTEVSRLEDAIEDWLADHGIADGWELADELVQNGVSPEQLDALARDLPAEALSCVLTWVAETATARELSSVVVRSTERIAELVTAVKAYSYMDRAVEQMVDVHEGLENTLVILAHRLRGVTIVREYAETLPPVRALGSGLNQVWTNILDNAGDAVGEEGVVTIRTRALDRSVVVEIEDNGCGIPPEDLTRIFEPFFSTKPQGAGTGLGLDMVWRIVTEEHGGTVEVESEPGRTRFRVTLPAG